MKVYLLFLLCMMTIATQAKSETTSENLEITVDELEKYLMGFLHGLHIDQYANATLVCKSNFDDLLADAFLAYNAIQDKKYYEGTLSLADTLGETSPLARNCSVTTDQMILGIHTYINSFDSFQTWITTVEKNVWSNFVRISLDTNDLVAELQSAKTNYTHVFEIVGEIVHYSVSANQTNGALKYTQTDPLAPAPLNEVVWTVFESIYEFFTASTLATHEPLSKCEGAIISMMLYDSDGYNNIVAKNTEEGIFLILDSFIFLHDIVEQCSTFGSEVYVNGTTVYNTIAANPDVIMDNFKANMFHVLSGSAATYAQVYHKDVISFFKVLGGVVQQTLVAQPEVEQVVEEVFHTADL